MTAQEKRKAVAKAELALSKIQDLFYMNLTPALGVRNNQVCDAIRDLVSAIENTKTIKH